MSTRCRLLLRSLLVSLLSTAVIGQSSPSTPKKTQGSTTESSQQAVVLEQSGNRLSFQSDGTGTRELSERIRVQSEAGVRALAVLSFAYTTSNQTLDVDYVRVRKPDGTVIATPAYNIQDMPADLTRVAPMYSDIHEKHVAVKGLGVGDELEYVLRYRTLKPEVPGQFWFEYTFPKNIIAKDELLEISVPRGKYVKVKSPSLKPEVTEAGDTRIYTWKTSNLKVEDSSEQAKKTEAPQPSVQVTTFQSWDEVGRWYGQLQGPEAAVTPAIRAKAEELTKGLTTDDAKIRALYKYVANQFHYVSLSFGIGRYQPHAAQDVLENEYGDCKDKHTLLQALLKAAGYDSYPALINSSRKLDPDVPSPAQFDHVITAVAGGNTLQWLDTTSEVAPFGLLTANLRDKQALLIPADKPASLVTTPADPPFPTDDLFDVNAKLSADGTLTGHIEHTSRGDLELLYRLAFRNVPAAEWKELAQRISYASGFGGEVSAVTASVPEDTSKPFQYAYDYTRKDYSDWKDRLITPPMPPFGVEARADNDKKPTEPIFLGALGQLVHRARVELPSGYSPKLPKNVDLTTNFAEYHSTYSLKDGVLTAERRLLLKRSKLQPAQWDDYRKFGKAIAEDEDTWIALNGNAETPALGGNAEADRVFQQGYDALQNRDLTTASEDFRKTLQLDPKHAYAHANLGVIYLMQNNSQDGLGELRKEEELHPDNDFAYRTMALALTRLHRNDEAIEQWRQLLKVNPKNRDAASGLSGLLIGAKKYAEAVSVLENSLKLSPDSEALQANLGFAYLRNGQSDKGIPILETVAQSDPKPETLNNIGYELADANVDLDKALAFAQKAVSQTQAQSLLFGASSPEGLRIASQLSAYWDTLGWAYFRRSNLIQAESYLRAAWELAQSPVIGDHLAQTYERQGKRKEAEHIYRLALSAARGNDEDIRQHYEHLTGKNPDKEWRCCVMSPGEELSRARMTKVSSSSHPSGSATYAIAFSPGKAPDVAFISGNASLKSFTDRIAGAKFHIEFPGQDPVKVVRRGILSCGSLGCDFTLLLPGDAAASALSTGK